MHIRQVWDYRLSTASVYIDRRGGTWVCVVVSKDNPDYNDEGTPTPPLETHDTGIKATKDDAYDEDKLKACYKWFRSVRDKYALPNIEELKPLVADINKANATLAAAAAGAK